MVESSGKSARQQQIDKNENQIYLESNELNKLMETLMGQIRQNKPDDIVSGEQQNDSLYLSLAFPSFFEWRRWLKGVNLSHVPLFYFGKFSEFSLSSFFSV